MIYTTGYVTIIDRLETKPRKKYNRKYLKMELLEEEELEASLKIKYAYTAFLPKSYDCRFLEDYTGKIKPFIEHQLSKRVVSLQVTHMNYVSEETVQKMKRRKKT